MIGLDHLKQRRSELKAEFERAQAALYRLQGAIALTDELIDKELEDAKTESDRPIRESTA